MYRVALSTIAPSNARRRGGRPAAFFNLLARIASARTSISVQSKLSASCTSRCVSSIGMVGRFDRVNISGCRLPPRVCLLMPVLLQGHEHQKAELQPLVDPPAQGIDLPAGFSHAPVLLSGAQ